MMNHADDGAGRVSWSLLVSISGATGVLAGLLGLMLGILSRPSNAQYLAALSRADAAERGVSSAKEALEEAGDVCSKLRLANQASENGLATAKQETDELRQEVAKLKARPGLPEWANPETLEKMAAENKELKRKLPALQRTIAALTEQRDNTTKKYDELRRKAEPFPEKQSAPSNHVRKIASFSGNGIKNTVSFSTTRPSWAVGWKASKGITITVKSASGEIVDIVHSEDANDSSAIRCPPGDYYLHVSSIGDWAINVVE